MYIWNLSRLNLDTVGHDEARSFVVIAPNEAEARLTASSECGDEGREVWHDNDLTNCLPIGTPLPWLELSMTASVVSRDYSGA